MNKDTGMGGTLVPWKGHETVITSACISCLVTECGSLIGQSMAFRLTCTCWDIGNWIPPKVYNYRLA